MKGDFEQRRQGWNQTENKPSCCECGNTDHFKAKRPIWSAKTKRSHNTNMVTENIGAGGGRKEVKAGLKRKEKGNQLFRILRNRRNLY